jgi:nucleoside-diphosphate-sugar epimerase
MRIAVTGASGFIGQMLCCTLLERGHEVVALCRKSFVVGTSQLDLFRHIPYTMGELLPKDVTNFSPEALVHLAWDGIPDFSERKCVDNLEAQIRFLKQIKNLEQLKKIISAGTCREYGAKQGACAESDRIQPDSYFSWAKQTLAEYLWISCQQWQVALVWFRIFYIYGPGQRSESLIPTLIRANNSKQYPEIKNPTAANDYVYIEDVVGAFVKAIENQECQGTFNLGSGITTTVAKIAKVVEQMMQKDSQFLDQRALKMDAGESNSGSWADTKLSASQLDWSPRISLIEGIKRTLMATL